MRMRELAKYSVAQRTHWQNVQRGHAATNMMPFVASNRVGTESVETGAITFYGSWVIAGPDGEKVAECDRREAAIITAEFDLDALALKRRAWGAFRDRRPDCYGAFATYGGATS